MNKSTQIDYQSLKMHQTHTVLGQTLYSFRDQYNRTVVVQSGDQFAKIMRLIRLAQTSGGVYA